MTMNERLIIICLTKINLLGHSSSSELHKKTYQKYYNTVITHNENLSKESINSSRKFLRWLISSLSSVPSWFFGGCVDKNSVVT